jgi:uncharacterized protein
MKTFKNLVSFCAIILMVSSMNLQSMEVGESDYGILNENGQECYEQLLQENYNDATKALLQITENFAIFVSKIEEPQALAVAEKLIENGADVNKPAEIGFKYTPLIYAVKNRSQNLANLLISNDAYINGNSTKELTPLDGYTPLKQAVTQNDPNMVKFLIYAGASINYADQQYGSTVLHIATLFAVSNTPDIFINHERHITKIEIIKFLLNNGADYSIPDFTGETPLSIAQQYSANTIENLLLTGECNPITDQSERSEQQHRRSSPSSLPSRISTPDSEYIIPFSSFSSIIQPNYEEEIRTNIMDYMWHTLQNNLTHTQSTTEPQQSSERYPKQSRHNWENIQKLSSKIKQASEDSETKMINQQNEQGKTNLMIAAQENNISAINYLLKNKADAGIFDNAGKTALDYACENKHQECIEALIIPTGLALLTPEDHAHYEKQLN